MNLDDCATQRVLSEKGRQNSRAIGEAIRALDVPIGPVLASPLCRTVETAVLAFGFAEKSMATRDGGREPVGSPGRYAALRVLLSTRVEDVEEGLANAVASVLVGKESR